MSVMWGAWALGMAASDPATLARFARMGMGAIRPAQGLLVLAGVLAASPRSHVPQVCTCSSQPHGLYAHMWPTRAYLWEDGGWHKQISAEVQDAWMQTLTYYMSEQMVANPFLWDRMRQPGQPVPFMFQEFADTGLAEAGLQRAPSQLEATFSQHSTQPPGMRGAGVLAAVADIVQGVLGSQVCT